MQRADGLVAPTQGRDRWNSLVSNLLCFSPLSLSLIPLPSLHRYAWRDLPADSAAALTVLFLAVPQGLAYATIAGLPPAVGLYSAAIPTVISAIFRSSSHVVSGPTNALSLLVGAAVGRGLGVEPAQVAITLALMVGVIQAMAGLLRLGSVVDFISSSVVLGYITGAGVLIGVGQLYNATGTAGDRGILWVTVGGWAQTLGDARLDAVAVALGTVAVVVAVRLLNKKLEYRIPAAIVAMALAMVASWGLGLERRGLRVVSDLAPIPTGLPTLTVPDLQLAPDLVGVAVACAVLSLVESSSVARSIASRSGQRLDQSTEFFGQGLSNLAAAFVGGYPVSGSLSRSTLNQRVGARTRVSGILAGLLMLFVLLAVGPVLDHTPVASLAGLMFVVAYDLVDLPKIRGIVGSSRADALAFFATMVGTWVLSLDLAIYLGAGISLVMFLRRVRMIRITELVPDDSGVLEERPLGPLDRTGACSRIRIVHVEGPLFFGAAGELRDGLTRALEPPSVGALVVRLKRTMGMDATTATALGELAVAVRAQAKRIVLVGVTADDMRTLERSGALAGIGTDCVFPTTTRWFSALQEGVQRAVQLTGDHDPHCPMTLSQVAPTPGATRVAHPHR